jgi:hypothetical protein
MVLLICLFLVGDCSLSWRNDTWVATHWRRASLDSRFNNSRKRRTNACDTIPHKMATNSASSRPLGAMRLWNSKMFTTMTAGRHSFVRRSGNRRRHWCGRFCLQLWKPPETFAPHSWAQADLDRHRRAQRSTQPCHGKIFAVREGSGFGKILTLAPCGISARSF